MLGMLGLLRLCGPSFRRLSFFAVQDLRVYSGQDDKHDNEQYGDGGPVCCEWGDLRGKCCGATYQDGYGEGEHGHKR